MKLMINRERHTVINECDEIRNEDSKAKDKRQTFILSTRLNNRVIKFSNKTEIKLV